MGATTSIVKIDFTKEEECNYFLYFFYKLKQNEIPILKTSLNLFEDSLIWKIKAAIGSEWGWIEEAPLIEKLFRKNPKNLEVHFYGRYQDEVISLVISTCFYKLNITELIHYSSSSSSDGFCIEWINDKKYFYFEIGKIPEHIEKKLDSGWEWDDDEIIKIIIEDYHKGLIKSKQQKIQTQSNLDFIQRINQAFYDEVMEGLDELQKIKSEKITLIRP